MNHAKKAINRKLSVILIASALLLCVIALRLVHLQIHLGIQMHKRSVSNFMRYQSVAPQRGDIVDTRGKMLATSRPVVNLLWQRAGSGRLTTKQLQAITNLEELLGTKLDRKALAYTQRHASSLVLAQDLNAQQLCTISEKFPNHPNIALTTESRRHYPYQSVGCHILGYLGNMQTGKTGLEKMYDDYLAGTHGKSKTIINSSGKHLAFHEIQQATVGKRLVTTLDIDLQRMLHRTFPRPYAGTAILMNSYTGALRAVHSYPIYNPEMFLSEISNDKWQQVNERNPFINRALQACYPPASIFKLISCAAALEQGLIDQDHTFCCKGSMRFGRRRYFCNLRTGHGPDMHTLDGLIHSCNILFYQIGQKIKIDQLAQYAHIFGLGDATGIQLPERTGLIPTAGWKKQTKGERWWTGETMLAAIGQSFMLVTPLQIARAIASIETGYLVAPRILENEGIQREPLAIADGTRDFLNHAMELVVTEGTARKLGKLEGFIVRAKTGTAQTSHWTKRGLGKEHLEHVWFVANFCYRNGEPLTLVMLAENAGASRIVTNAAKRLFNEYRVYIDGKIE
jgi:penicillin-binding protein 2